MKALLIIDMQKGCLHPYSNFHDTLAVIDRINILSRKFREKNYPVIIIRHDASWENCLIPGSEEWQLIPELSITDSDILIDKTANDSFYNTALQKILGENQVNELFVTGATTDFCIDATIKSALSKDYNVIAVADAHTTENKPYIAAQTLVRHFNWVWSVMAPTKGRITVMNTQDITI